VAVSDRAAGIVRVVIHAALGLLFVRSGAAAGLWQRVEGDVSWHTGPTAVGVISYFAVFWCAWFVLDQLVRFTITTRRSGAAAAAAAARFFVASCVLVATQVLIPYKWLLVTLAILLLAYLLHAYIIREPMRRAVTSWAWSGAGIALATLLIHPWFIGQPLFVVRLAIVMTLWDWIGERLGVMPRLLRFVPSFYSGSSGWIAAHARVAR
jgi:hypothetical protein